jgi:ATP-dependent DNA helicase RecG
MSDVRSPSYVHDLINELIRLPHETEWVEFKHNYAEPEEIGEYISALSNAATLANKQFSYMLWGIDNNTHALIGTGFAPATARKGNEELVPWLLRMLAPRIDFHFETIVMNQQRIVILHIPRAAQQPVSFQGKEYIRVGTNKKSLKDYPELERKLWRTFESSSFEQGVAYLHGSDDEVIRMLDYPVFFELLEQPLPTNKSGILTALSKDQLIIKNDAGGWDITNLGAVLFAKRLDSFRSLRRKAMRVIQYRGLNRNETLREQEFENGYASGFTRIINHIRDLLPANEVINQHLRRSVPMFPELAIRELVANALIHQDFYDTGTGPMVEIFDDRIEITNPGEPLVDTERFIDTPPKSRNEDLASLMRRFRICEERGSGIDKVVSEVESFQLPAPLFERPKGFTRSVLFAHKALIAMDKVDRVRACYLHACICYVSRREMSNTTLRTRFGVAEQNRSTVSRLIKEALEAGVIIPSDPSAAPKLMRYVPYWVRVDHQQQLF